MVGRVNLILKAKNISARQFAEEIGIQPSGMSHILSGRNKPSLDFVQKVIRRWPEINISWLMFGKGEMFVSDIPTVHSSSLQSDIHPIAKHEQVQPRQNGTQYDLFSNPEDDNRPSPLNTKETNTLDMDSASQPNQNSASDVTDVKDETETQNPSQTSSAYKSIPHENALQHSPAASDVVQAILGPKKILKFIVYYDDHTYCEYLPNENP